MAQDGSQRKSKRSKGKTKRRKTTTITNTATVNRDADRERTNTVQRLDAPPDRMDKMPSNAPTMAIAPSDYEHIFHEAQAPQESGRHSPEAREQRAQRREPTEQRLVSPLLPAQQAPVSPPLMSPPPVAPQLPQFRPTYMLPTYQGAQQTVNGQSPDMLQQQNIWREPTYGARHQYYQEVQVTPDGYTMLGHAPDTSAQRRALPPHIVRASNQFSRAALARVARYLASRADPPRLL